MYKSTSLMAEQTMPEPIHITLHVPCTEQCCPHVGEHFAVDVLQRPSAVIL